MKILLDVDGVIADLVGALCAELTAEGCPARPEQITSYNFKDCLSEEQFEIAQFAMARPGFCSSIPWYLGARGFVEELAALGEVVFVTKPFSRGATWAHERERWLRESRLPVIHTGAKHHVAGDFLVEDSIDNAESWLATHAKSNVVLVDRPWNRGTPCSRRVYRAGTYLEALRLVGNGIK